MLICRGDTAYRCSEIKTYSVGETKLYVFDIFDNVSHAEIADLFADNTFYFYDEAFECRMIEISNKKLVGLSITYNDDSTCKIRIKLKKGDVGNES